MFDREDVVFRDALDRIYHRLLYGDGSSDQIAGYYGALKGSQTWEAHKHAIGRIEGIEICIEEMRALAQKMIKEDHEPQRYDRSMN
jgi:hypothetical protein